MKYLCLAFGDEEKMEALSKSEFDALIADCQTYDAELHKTGHLVPGKSLSWGSPPPWLPQRQASSPMGPSRTPRKWSADWSSSRLAT